MIDQATVVSFEREDKNGRFLRTALQMEDGANSFDVVDSQGNLIVRINPIQYVNEKGVHWSIDICCNVEREDQQVRVINWKNGNGTDMEEPGNTTTVLLITES